jgi:hypothetical protein
MEQLDLFDTFALSLPNRPYCSDDLDAGLQIRDKLKAKTKKYIQANPPALIHWLAFDCDYQCAVEFIKDNDLPFPNFAVINPLNGHSHLLYGLSAPVCNSDNARLKPLNYLAAVEYALREKLEADQGYCGLIVKNPLNAHWNTYELQDNLWDLGALAEYLTLPQKLPKKALSVGLGRNCSLFEVGRLYAYKNCLMYRTTSTKAHFYEAILSYLQSENQSFPVPLNFNELKGIAKSISGWTWKNYTGRKPDKDWQEYVRATHTPEIQSKRGKLGGRPKTTTAEGKPWEVLGISRATWYRKNASNH